MIQELVLYGAGKRCRNLCKVLQQTDIDVVAVLDSDPDKWGEEIEGYQIQSPQIIKELSNVNMCITIGESNALRAVRDELQRTYQYDLDKEIHYYKLILDVYKEDSQIKQKLTNQRLTDKYNGKSFIFSSIYGFTLGGVQAWTKDICEALVKNGRENVYVISKKGDYDVPLMLKKSMICVDGISGGDFSKESVLNVIDAILTKLPCKIIITQADVITMGACLVKHYLPDMIDIISTIRGSNNLIYQNYMDFQEYADIHIGVSLDIKRDMIQLGIEPERMYSMCVPFDCDEFLVRTYTEDESLPIRIGYAARMFGIKKSDKRLDLLLELMLLLDKKGVNFKMELAGDGPAKKEMEEYVRSHCLEDKVEFLGEIDRSSISSFWKKQDICVSTSGHEGRSHGIIEGMGNGAVPIVTATSGVREDITDGVNGYIVPLGDYQAMAERIEYLAQHRERLSQMGKLAHDVVYPKSTIESHLEFWNDILSGTTRNINSRLG